MLFRELLTDELNKQREDFSQFARSQADDLDDYLSKLKRISEKSQAEIEAAFENAENVGALPSEEFDAARNFSINFAEKWANHEEARAWAFEILQNRTTFAADGSQLFVEREVSLPVAAIQIGWFENPHDAAQSYEKNARFSVLSPADLLSQDEPVIPETRVGQKRFEAEVNVIKEFLHKKQGWKERGERMPLAFYDGTLLLSIALPRTKLQDEYIKNLVELVRLSRDAEVPLVGYVDRSYARDLMAMLDAFEGRKGGSLKTLDDVSILHVSALKNWGDRTPFCYCNRRGLEAFSDPNSQKPLVGFVYLQTTGENLPARLDIPTWIYEKSLLPEVLDAVRAECVIGLGYPYALETADQTAVITLRDREIFLQALQGFAKENNLNLRVSRKAASKGRRR